MTSSPEQPFLRMGDPCKRTALHLPPTQGAKPPSHPPRSSRASLRQSLSLGSSLHATKLMPRKATFTPVRKQELINTLRALTAAAWHARGNLRYHLCKSESLYKEADDLYARLCAFEKRAASELQLPKPTEIGFPSYTMPQDGTLPK